jgi:hypothetical protein
MYPCRRIEDSEAGKKRMKYTTTSFDVDGMHIELKRVPVRTREYSFRNAPDGTPIMHPEEQALYEIAVDGEACGLASRPHGFGKQNYNIERVGKSFEGGLREVVVWGRGYIPHEQQVLDLPAVAAKIAVLRRERDLGIPKLPTRKELAEFLAKHRAEAAAAKKERERRSAEFEREMQERDRAEDETFDLVIDGLASIDERLKPSLTNAEIAALRTAIDEYKGKRATKKANKEWFAKREG